MAKGKPSHGNVRFVFAKSSPLLKCVVLVTILFCTGCLIFIRAEISRLRSQTESLRHEGASQEQTLADLQEHISQLGTVQGIKYIAETKLGLVDPDTIIFVPTDSTGK